MLSFEGITSFITLHSADQSPHRGEDLLRSVADREPAHQEAPEQNRLICCRQTRWKDGAARGYWQRAYLEILLISLWFMVLRTEESPTLFRIHSSMPMRV